MRSATTKTPVRVAATLALLAPVALAGMCSAEATPRHKPATARVTLPVLEARAQLSADHLEPGPPSGAQATPANGRTGPFPGQVIPGFSAMLDNGDGTYWGLPDNGFGAKANSADFLLRLYLVRPNWETAGGGKGDVDVLKYVQLRDPLRKAGFTLTNDGTADRALTGADFDVESVVRAQDGSFWIGEEFGPFLLHFSADGVLLQAPAPLPGVKSASNPFLKSGEIANLRNSKGFEAMAGSRQGRYLYPILEGYLNGDNPRRRVIYQFDTRKQRYTGRTWSYQTDTDDSLAADAFAIDDHRMLILERDDFWGPKSVIKRVYQIDLRREDRSGMLRKNLLVDLLKIANPNKIGQATDPGAYGVGDPFSFPFQSVETLVGLKDGRLLIADDNNYPSNDARYPGKPDNTELITITWQKNAKVAANPADHIVFAHRGASGYRPEHTLAAYELAIQQCADYIEPDLVSTKDGVLVDRHENEISGTTNVAEHPEFAARRTTKVIDGKSITGWFTEDFTLAELRTLRAKERLPQVRPANTAYDGLYPVPTFAEVVDFARHSRTCDGKQVGVIPEIKHGTYFDSIGLSQEEPTVKVLQEAGLNRRSAPVIIQSFEVANLQELKRTSRVHLVQLVDCSGAPADWVKAGRKETYADLATAVGLKEVAKYADSVGFCKDVMFPKAADGSISTPSAAITNAHAAGLEVTGWTFRVENSFLPTNFRSSTDPAAKGDLKGEIKTFLRAGMDNVFSDNPDIAVEAVREYAAGR